VVAAAATMSLCRPERSGGRSSIGSPSGARLGEPHILICYAYLEAGHERGSMGWVFTITLAAGSWIGALGVLFSSYTVVAWSIVFVLANRVGFVDRVLDGCWTCNRHPVVSQTPVAPEPPSPWGVVALQVLLFNYFPNSSFSGLKGCANDRCP